MLVFFSSRRRHTRFSRDWSSDVCSSDLIEELLDLGTGRRVPVPIGLPRIDLELEGTGSSADGDGELEVAVGIRHTRSEEHTSELQSRENLVCRLLLEKKKKKNEAHSTKE